MADDLAKPASESSPFSEGVQNAIFKRELDQVYLLIDHITTRETKRLPGSDQGLEGNDADLMKRVFEIKYPPGGTHSDRAAQASTLVRVLDELNRAAAPANGMTIAFTLLVVGEQNSRGTGPADDLRSRPDQSLPTRLDLAIGAFPTLQVPARRFKLFNTCLIYGLVGAFLLTCALSWNVAIGNAFLGQVKTLSTELNSIDKQVAAAMNSDGGAGAEENRPPTSAPNPPGSDDDCERFANRRVDSATGIPLCDQKEKLERELRAANRNLRNWSIGLPWRLIAPPNLKAPEQSRAAQFQRDGQLQRDAAPSDRRRRFIQRVHEGQSQWAAVILQVLGGAVLPIFYGLLGAGAAVVRRVSARFRESVLAPRDLMLSIVQLVLGAVIGGCIGLFITPAGTDAQGSPSLLGTVQLSASALCFIAGFGVEGVFAGLETLIRRIFNLPDPAMTAVSQGWSARPDRGVP